MWGLVIESEKSEDILAHTQKSTPLFLRSRYGVSFQICLLVVLFQLSSRL